MKSIYILAALSASAAIKLGDDATTVDKYPAFLIRKAESDMAMEAHEANKHDAQDNVDQSDDKYSDDDISHAFLKSGESADPKMSAEYRKRQAENEKKAREWKQKNDDPTGAMQLKAQLDNERREMGIFTEEEQDEDEARSKFRSPNWLQNIG